MQSHVYIYVYINDFYTPAGIAGFNALSDDARARLSEEADLLNKYAAVTLRTAAVQSELAALKTSPKRRRLHGLMIPSASAPSPTPDSTQSTSSTSVVETGSEQLRVQPADAAAATSAAALPR